MKTARKPGKPLIGILLFHYSSQSGVIANIKKHFTLYELIEAGLYGGAIQEVCSSETLNYFC